MGPGVPTVPTPSPPRLAVCRGCVARTARPRRWKLPPSAGHRQTQPRLSLQDCSLCLITTPATRKRGCLWDSANQATDSQEGGMKCHRTVASDPATPLHSQVHPENWKPTSTRNLSTRVHTGRTHDSQEEERTPVSTH